MNDLPLEFHPEAVLEAWVPRHWYAERDPRAEDAFLAELDYAQAEVSAHPDRWPTYLHGTRWFRRFPYLLIYHATPERVVVLAVAHARRRPGYWKGRQTPWRDARDGPCVRHGL